MVKKAARLAVYDDMMISVKNHQALPTIRPDKDLKLWTINNESIVGSFFPYIFDVTDIIKFPLEY